MAYWLMKTEPGTWGWDDQVKKGAPQEWDGVRNYAARNFMREMQIGDECFFYHSINEKSIVGIVRVTALAHPDSTSDDPRWECVDIEAVKPVPNPVTLEDIKANSALADMILVNNSRLSVQPVRDEEWNVICKMAGL